MMSVASRHTAGHGNAASRHRPGSCPPGGRSNSGPAESLRRVRLFAELSPDALRAVAEKCRWQHLDAGRQVIGYHERSTEIFFVLGGVVRVVLYSLTGREVSFRDLGEGEFFGELAAIDGEPRSANVVALTDACVASLPARAFRRTMAAHPEVADAVLKHLTHLVRFYSQRLYEFGTLGVRDRFHAEIVRMARDCVRPDGSAVIDPAPTHAEIASRISARREAVSREFSHLVREGLVERSGTTWVIRDFGRLAQMVQSLLGG